MLLKVLEALALAKGVALGMASESAVYSGSSKETATWLWVPLL